MKYTVAWICLMLVCGVVSAQNVVFFADENLKTAIQDALCIWWDPTGEDLEWETRLKNMEADQKITAQAQANERKLLNAKQEKIRKARGNVES